MGRKWLLSCRFGVTAKFCLPHVLRAQLPYARLHTVNKMAEDTDALFIFGNDLEAILDALEEDEGVHEEFSAAVSNV